VRAALASSLLLGMTLGCANLTAIGDFAATSSEAAGYSRLVDQYAAWPEGEKRFEPESHWSQLDDLTAARKTQRKELLLYHTAIDDYMDALGRLAADALVSYDDEIDGLAKAVRSTPLGTRDRSEVAAAASISKLLAKAVTDAWRQRELADLIEEANAPLQVVIAALKTEVDQGFAGDLDIEQTAIDLHYKRLERESHDPAGRAAALEWERAHRLDVDDRRRAIKAQSAILAKIARAHQVLYDQRDQLDDKELLREIEDYARQLRKLQTQLKAA